MSKSSTSVCGRQKNLRIGFLSAHDPADRRTWSGIIHYLATALERHAGEVIVLGPVVTGFEPWGLRLHWKADAWFNKRYDYQHCLIQALAYANRFKARLRRNPVDVIFAPVAATEIALLTTKIPIVYMSDTTFAAMLEYYPEFSELLTISRNEGNFIERRAISKAARLIYPSQWTADSAVSDYGADRDKIHVFPMAANIDSLPSPETIAQRRRGDCLRLLFVGVDWRRKGGPVAFEALTALERMDIPARLTVIGCVPPAGFEHPALTVIPFLNKNQADERARLSQIYLESDIFILPTRAECAGIVFGEAAAFGLPAFASATGGVDSMVEHGKTGWLLPLSASGDDYAQVIAELWRNPPLLAEMSRASRARFDACLNWDAWGKQAAGVLQAAAGLTPATF